MTRREGGRSIAGFRGDGGGGVGGNAHIKRGEIESLEENDIGGIL